MTEAMIKNSRQSNDFLTQRNIIFIILQHFYFYFLKKYHIMFNISMLMETGVTGFKSESLYEVDSKDYGEVNYMDCL